MAIVSKGGPGGAGGQTGPQAKPGGGGPPRTNLPPRHNPVAGRRAEFVAVADAFQVAAGRSQAARVEISGRPGVGATWTALELAWRNGARYPGGAWYVHLGMGEDMAWADVAAVRGRRITRDLAKDAEDLRNFVHEGPKALVVLDGATSKEQIERQIGPVGDEGPDVLIVTETVSGYTDLVVPVSDVPHHAPRRIALGYLTLRDGEDAAAPAVRSTDGLAITACLAARLAVRYDGKQGPIDVPNLNAGMQAMAHWVQANGLALEALLLCSLAHPVRIAMDALFEGLTVLRRRTGEPPKPEEVVQAMHELIGHGVLSVDDPNRVSMHPLLQEIVRGFLRTDEDRRMAREMLAAGLMHQARNALHDGALDVLVSGLHQLRFVAGELTGTVAEEARQVLDDCETAAGLRGGGTASNGTGAASGPDAVA